MIKEILCCIAGTLCFAVTMNTPRRTLLYITIGAGLTSAIERFLNGYYGDLTACFAAMLCLVFYCELTARILEIPVTVILMPSTIPLLPGSTIYYTMLYAVKSDTDKMLEYAKATISTGLGIALGATVSTIIIRLAVSLAKKCRK